MAKRTNLTTLTLPSRQLGIDAFAAVLLVGGFGTRLRTVIHDTPKPLATVGSRTFLELLIWQLRSQGIRRLIMCTGYLAEQIENKFGDGGSWGVSIEYSMETTPLGTAGAVKLAQSLLKDLPEFLVINGDSFLEIDLRQLIAFHHEHKGQVSMAVVRVENAGRYGTVQLDPKGRVTGFSEKTGRDGAGLVNAGVYVFNSELLEHIPDGPASLERDVFPHAFNRGVYGMEQRGVFIDIGTPEDYARAQALHDSLCKAALKTQMGTE